MIAANHEVMEEMKRDIDPLTTEELASFGMVMIGALSMTVPADNFRKAYLIARDEIQRRGGDET
jgi:hypothetical protein